MKKTLILLLLVMPFQIQAKEVDCDNAMTTYEMNVCAGREMDAANAKLEKYLAEARKRYADDKGVLDRLNKSQDAWLAYRDTACDAVYEIWSGGTIRGMMFGSCMLTLTQQRTHKVWKDYLTYMDSTPPLLPEPR